MPETLAPERIKAIRRSLGLTQEEFARRLHVAHSTVARWETGKQRPQGFLVHALLEMERAPGAG